MFFVGVPKALLYGFGQLFFMCYLPSRCSLTGRWVPTRRTSNGPVEKVHKASNEVKTQQNNHKTH